jgi:hypothetical protein
MLMGTLPFHFTCSDAINVLVIDCGFSNAFVHFGDVQGPDFPCPANSNSSSNHDIIFYMCRDMLDNNPNALMVANVSKKCRPQCPGVH